MTNRTTIVSIAISIAFSACKPNHPTSNKTNPEKKPITGVEINLMPAFNSNSIITIDKPLNTIQFKIDTIDKPHYAENPTVFSMSLDSFRVNTLIDSFFSQSFLDSIKFRPNDFTVLDGLSIFTVIRRGNISDTINSANVYPEILVENIMSHIDYISRKATDPHINKYIDDLRKYFQ